MAERITIEKVGKVTRAATRRSRRVVQRRAGHLPGAARTVGSGRRRCCAAWPASSGPPRADPIGQRTVADGKAPTAAGPARPVHGVPGLRALAAPVRPGQRGLRAAPPAPVRRADARRGRRTCSTGSGWAPSRTGTRTSCPAASSSGSALARALVADTGLILCDEPLSNLDADLRERMRVEISALVREAAATTVYITHDQGGGVRAGRPGGRALQARPPGPGWAPRRRSTRARPSFVARFTGLAGELPVRVQGRLAGHARR